MHSVGLLHRDMKPENFVESIEDQKIFLIDFGLGKSYMSKGKHIKKGNGLGLYQAKLAAQRLKGDINLLSTKKPITFEVSIQKNKDKPFFIAAGFFALECCKGIGQAACKFGTPFRGICH